MKRIFTIAILALIANSLFAYYGESILNLRFADNAPMMVYMDGRQLTNVVASAEVTNLSAGRHYLQVYKSYRKWDYESLNIAFSGYVDFRPNTELFATIYQGNVLNIDREGAINNDPSRYSDANAHKYAYDKHDTRYYENYRLPANDAVSYSKVPSPICSSEFAQLKQTIANAWFEDTKLTIFKQALAYNYFTTCQVRELMDLYSFESSKLEVAKCAYPKTLDKNNYYVINNGFSFSSSVAELGEYVAMR